MGLAQGLAFWPPPARKPALDTLPARELAHHPPTAWGVTPIPRRLGVDGGVTGERVSVHRPSGRIVRTWGIPPPLGGERATRGA
jgi:hypothetical protein